MTTAPRVQAPESDSTRLFVSWVFVLLSAGVVILFVVCAVLSVSTLLKYPEQILPDQWTRAQSEEILSPLAIPTNWLVWSRLLPELAFAVTALVIAGSIFVSRPKELFSYYVAFWLVLHGTFSGIFAETVAQLHPALAPLTKGLLMVGWFGVFLLAYVFPTGRFIPRWTVASIPFFLAAFLLLFPPYVLGQGESSPLIAALLLALAIAGILAQGYRFAMVSTPLERQQTKWVILAIMARIVYLIVISIPAVREMITNVTRLGLATQILMGFISFSIASLLPIAVGVAILRYRLWDLEPILNRTFVYGGLTLFSVGAYGLVVGGIGALLGAQDLSPLLSIITIGLVAITFQPLRERLQRMVNRLMYGERDEPYRVLARLGERLEAVLEPVNVLPLTVNTVAEALRLPYVAIALKHDGELQTVATYGAPPDKVTRFPLITAGETVGELIAAPRAPPTH
jgi:hypothetical protein